jgi:hypothetical protein
MTITIKRASGNSERTYISDTVPQIGAEISIDGDLFRVTGVTHHIAKPTGELVDVYVTIIHRQGMR